MCKGFPTRLLIIGLLTCAQPACAETVAEAVARGIRHHPEVRAYEYDQLASDAGVDAARGARLPRVSLSSDAGAENVNGPTADSTNLSLSVTQSLYDGGEVLSQIRRSREEARAAQSRFEDATSAIGLQILQAYIEVQRSRKVVDVMKRNLKSLADIQKRVKLRADAGFGNGAEVSQAMSRVEGAREQLIAAEQQLADAAAEFQVLTGMPPGRLEPVAAPKVALPGSVEAAVSLAANRSPRILAVTYDALAAAASADVAAAASAPRINLRLGLGYDADGFNNTEDRSTASAMLVVRYDLYDGGTRKARERQARLRAEASRQDALMARKEVELEVRRSWNAVIASQQRTGPLKRRAEAARKSLSLHVQRYSAGKSTLDTLLSLQEEAASSEIAYLNELASGRYHVYRMQAATGRFLPSLGLTFSTVDNLR